MSFQCLYFNYLSLPPDLGDFYLAPPKFGASNCQVWYMVVVVLVVEVVLIVLVVTIIVL